MANDIPPKYWKGSSLVIMPYKLVERLNNRIAETKAAGGDVRADDNEETFRHRLSVYREQTAPLIPYYEECGLLRTVDGMASIDDVAREIDSVFATLKKAEK